MIFTPYPPDGARASDRDINLEGSPATLVEGIKFSLEIKSLMSGIRDQVKNDNSADIIQRDWTFEPAGVILVSTEPSPVSAPPEGTSPATPVGGSPKDEKKTK